MSDFLPISLPSRCMTYGIDPTDIQIRPYTGQDEVYLSQINPVNVETKYTQVLERVLKGIDPKSLTLGDRLYIILWEFINSYSNTLRVKSVCSHCLNEVEHSVDLRKLDVVTLPDGYSEPHALDIDGETIHVRLTTVGDEVEVEKLKNKADAEMYQYARIIVDDDDVVTRMEKLKKGSAKKLARIRLFQSEFYHGPDMNTHVTCPKCGEEDDLAVPFRFDFIFPDGSLLRDSIGA